MTEQQIHGFFRREKRTCVRDYLDVLEGRLPEGCPYWESTVDAKMASFILEKNVPSSLSPDFPVEDLVELARRTGIRAVGFGIYFKRGLASTGAVSEAFAELRKQPRPDFSRDFARLERLCLAAEGTGVGVFVYVHGPLDPVYLCLGLERFWLQSSDNFPVIEEIGDFFLEVHVEIAERLCRYPISLLHIGDDVAFKSGLMLRPEVLLPYYDKRLARLLAPARRKGIPVTLHSDGAVEDIVPVLVKHGVSGLHPVEPYSNDIVALHRKYGEHISLIGNVELVGKSCAEVVARAEELRRAMPARYIPASSHSITDDVSPATYAAFLQAVGQT